MLSLKKKKKTQRQEIKEVIELPIKHPELFDALGVAQPKGVLLYGPPGTGKTLLARAVAHHTDCTFIRVSGSELVQKYIGEGSRMVRELFVMAREHAPSIIFMDEVRRRKKFFEASFLWVFFLFSSGLFFHLAHARG